MAHQLCRSILRVGHLNSPLLRITQQVTLVPTASKVSVFERDRKGGYAKKRTTPHTTMIKDGLKEMKRELNLCWEEVKDKFHLDPLLDVRHGDYMYAWKFHDRESIESWVTTCDRDHNEGYSQVNFELGKNNTGIFHGYVSQEIPKDGVIKKAGYCNIRSPSKFLSFKRKVPHDWSPFNCLLLRLRGDGRPYMLTMAMDRYWDLNWNDQYHYPLYTRGGPYWQVAKIPFSKFFLTSKGRVQDKQEQIDLTKVANVGISIADGSEGPFELEIDFIAVMYDENHVESFAYEMYQANPEHVGT